jgi:signal transduction histidine kinase
MIERLQLLAAVSATLAGSLDHETSVGEVATLPIRSIADWSVLYLCAEPGDAGKGPAVVRREIATRVEGAEALLERLRHLPHDSEQSLVRETLRTGQSLLVASLEGAGALPGPVMGSSEGERLIPAVGAVSLMVVPLKARQHITGALLLLSSRPGHHYGAADVQLAEQLAQLSALILENARQHRETHAANSARNEVLNVVAHDLRSPINGILLTLDFLAEKLQERGAGDLVDPWITGLQASTRTMNRIVGELLEITRIEGGQVKLDRRPLDAAYVVERAVTEARTRHPEVILEARVSPRLPAVDGDETRVVQILGCLIGNLSKFRSEEAGEITVSAEEDGADLRFCVRDARSEIAADELEHLFDRFWQAGHLDRRGAALGLSIAKALVVMHGGRIWADSGAERGTTFYFTLS